MATNRLRKFRSKSIERCTGYEKKNCESCTATSVAEGKHDVGVSGVQHESARFAISEPTASVVGRHAFTGGPDLPLPSATDVAVQFSQFFFS